MTDETIKATRRLVKRLENTLDRQERLVANTTVELEAARNMLASMEKGK